MTLFSCCGKVDHVYLHSKPTAGLPEEDKSKFFPTLPKIQVLITVLGTSSLFCRACLRHDAI